MSLILKAPPKIDFCRARAEARRIAASFNLNTFPVDPFAVLRGHPHVSDVIFHPMAPERDGVVVPLPSLALENHNARYILVVFNSLNLGYGPDHVRTRRLRWSGGHELGHVVLNHAFRFPRYVLHGDDPDEEHAAEAETNVFAEELLMPTWEFARVSHLSVDELMDYFGVNREPVLRRIASFERYLRALGFGPRYVWIEQNSVFARTSIQAPFASDAESHCGKSNFDSDDELDLSNPDPHLAEEPHLKDVDPISDRDFELKEEPSPDDLDSAFEVQEESEFEDVDPHFDPEFDPEGEPDLDDMGPDFEPDEEVDSSVPLLETMGKKDANAPVDFDLDFEPDDEPPPDEPDPDFDPDFEFDSDDGAEFHNTIDTVSNNLGVDFGTRHDAQEPEPDDWVPF